MKTIEKQQLKNKFSDYLNEQGIKRKELEDKINRFSLKIFDIFLYGLKEYKKNPDNYSTIFNNYVLPELKKKINKGSIDVYFDKKKTYIPLLKLFKSFMGFCRLNTDYIDGINFGEESIKMEGCFDGEYKKMIKKRHTYIKNDKGKNSEKIRGYLGYFYGLFDKDEIKNLYRIFLEAYIDFSEKKKDNKVYKGNLFNISFEKILKNKSIGKLNTNDKEKIKSIFGKYLYFIGKNRKDIEGVIKMDLGKIENMKKETKKTIIDIYKEDQEDNIIEEIRDKNGENSDITDGGDVKAPLKNFSINQTDMEFIDNENEKEDIIDKNGQYKINFD